MLFRSSIAESQSTCATRLFEKLITESHEILTIIEGEGATQANTRRITEFLHERYPRLEVEVHPGGQPLYPYLFGIE